WTFFPDGFFERTFTFEFYKLHKNLRVHWPTQTLGAKRNPGSQDATDPKAGKLTERKCLGTMKCDTCRALTRPQTTPQMRRKQLAAGCYCGGELRLVPCEGHVVSKIYTFRHGVHYVNAGPSQLLFGDRSVTKISPLLFNKDRLAYERTRILKPTRVFKDNHFLEQIAAFENRHPHFAPRVYIEGKVTVIVLQSPFMRRVLLKDTVEDDAVNGIVSDASHGFFKQRNELLMVSSVFEPKNLQCWVPAMMSYFNGSTVDHYRIHFFHLLRSIAEECDDTDGRLTSFQTTSSQVVDFSDTQRKAFIEAFIDFWMDRAGTARSPQQLEKAAISLLRGCEQHFRSQVTRVKKIGGVVAP
ncbi:hypothetical protein DFH08DRAFT_620664, partial [Mycena albidolilacea]